MIHN